MGSVWKRLQRVNKRAAKFQFTVSYHSISVYASNSKWRPTNLSVLWTRRSRRVVSSPLSWNPDMIDPLNGIMEWQVPDNHTITVTLFKDPRTHELEDKDWNFILEDCSQMGKKRILATTSINMRKYASVESTQQTFQITLRPTTKKIASAQLDLTISCVFLREGKATDEDMQSVVSMMSYGNDVAPLDDLEDIPDLESSGDISEDLLDITQQLEQLTSSLNNSELQTPISVPSIPEDQTPLVEAGVVVFNHHNIDNVKDQKEIQQKLSIIAANDKKKIENKTVVSSSSTTTTTITTTAFASSKMSENNNLINNIDKDSSRVQKEKEKPSDSAVKPNINSKADNVIVEVKKQENSESKKEAELVFKPEKIEPIKLVSLKEDKPVAIQIQEKQKEKEIEKPEETTNSNNSVLPSTISDKRKRIDLQPLNLKKSYDFDGSHPEETKENNVIANNSTNNSNNVNLNKSSTLKDKTPGQDLLEWCKDITRNYENIKVTNLTTSFRNGMAFCAIIHHFRPDLIDMEKLEPKDVIGNCRTAFDTAEKLGIPRVIEPNDMNLLNVPDKLAVMTYLYQLHAHFTGRQLEVERIGQTTDESSYYLIGNLSKVESLSTSSGKNVSFNELKQQLFLQRSYYISDQPKSPTNKKDVKNILKNGSKSLFDKVLSPTKEKDKEKEKNAENAKPVLMTHRQLIDPFASDEEDEQMQIEREEKLKTDERDSEGNLSPPPNLNPEAASKIINRHKEQSEKAKELMEKLRNGNNDILKSNDIDEDERQNRLRQHARNLMAKARGKSLELDSPSSPVRPITQRITLSPERTISPINNNVNAFNYNNNSSDQNQVEQKSSPRGKSPTLQTFAFSNVLDRISPKGESKDKANYIQSELDALEREQEAIDKKANVLEKKLRAVMGGGTNTHSNEHESEDQLMAQWFTLVNKKNALIRRQMQLNILEQENDLERKYNLLNLELRAAMSIEDWRKTEEQRERESLLLADLVKIVDKRNELVQRLHNEEQAIEDDDEIERELVNVDINHKEKCTIS